MRKEIFVVVVSLVLFVVGTFFAGYVNAQVINSTNTTINTTIINSTNTTLTNSTNVSVINSNKTKIVNSTRVIIINSTDISVINSKNITITNSTNVTVVNSSNIKVDNTRNKRIENQGVIPGPGPEPGPTKCSESDGGVNYNVKGKITYFYDVPTDQFYGWHTTEDSCSSDNTLTEFSCDYYKPTELFPSRTVVCTNGCKDGACLVQPGKTIKIIRGDVNGDGVIDISDAIYLLKFLFEGTKAPPAPFPEAAECTIPR